MNSLKDLTTIFIIKNNIEYTPETLIKDCLEYVEFIKYSLEDFKTNAIVSIAHNLSIINNINLIKYIYKTFDLKLSKHIYDEILVYTIMYNNCIETVKFFIQQDANDTNHQSMYVALQRGYIEIIKLLILKNNHDLNNNTYIHKYFIHPYDLNNCMMAAAKYGHIEIVKFFIKQGANNWNEGLFGALEGGHLDIAEFFIKKGANNIRRCIEIAQRHNYTKIVEFLQKFK
jgi:ankyrin repeat protein